MSSDLAFYFHHVGESPIPARFQFASHQPVGRIGGVILTEGAVGGVARCFEIAAESLLNLIPALSYLLGGRRRRGDSAGANYAQQRLLDRIVDAQSAEGDAVGAAVVHPGTAAAVARNAVLRAGVAERQLAPAAPATDWRRRSRRESRGSRGKDRAPFRPYRAHPAATRRL